MNRVILGALGLAWSTALFAQPTPQPDPEANADAYQRIEAVRLRETAAFTQQETACYQRFAVNACLTDVQARRRALLADLKRQETVLHDSERAQKGAQQEQHAKQKAQENHDRQAQGSSDAAAIQIQDKQLSQQEKVQAHAAKLAASGVNAPRPAPQNAGPGLAEQTQNRDAYQSKQTEAQKKRQDIAKRQAEKAKKPVPPLPEPP